MDNREILTTKSTQDTRQVNVKKNRRGNKEWTIEKHWQHLAHKDTGQRKTKHNNTTQHNTEN